MALKLDFFKGRVPVHCLESALTFHCLRWPAPHPPSLLSYQRP